MPPVLSSAWTVTSAFSVICTAGVLIPFFFPPEDVFTLLDLAKTRALTGKTDDAAWPVSCGHRTDGVHVHSVHKGGARAEHPAWPGAARWFVCSLVWSR